MKISDFDTVTEEKIYFPTLHSIWDTDGRFDVSNLSTADGHDACIAFIPAASR